MFRQQLLVVLRHCTSRGVVVRQPLVMAGCAGSLQGCIAFGHIFRGELVIAACWASLMQVSRGASRSCCPCLQVGPVVCHERLLAALLIRTYHCHVPQVMLEQGKDLHVQLAIMRVPQHSVLSRALDAGLIMKGNSERMMDILGTACAAMVCGQVQPSEFDQLIHSTYGR